MVINIKDMPSYQQNFMNWGAIEVEWFFGLVWWELGQWDLLYPFKMGNYTPLIVDILCFEQATEKGTKIKYEYDQSGALYHIIILFLSKYFTANQTLLSPNLYSTPGVDNLLCPWHIIVEETFSSTHL